MVAVDVHLAVSQCFPTNCPYSDLTLYEFINALVYQLINYPYPDDNAIYQPFVPRQGVEPLRWFERIIDLSKQFVEMPLSLTSMSVSDLTTPSSIESDCFLFASQVSIESQVTVGKATLPKRWSIIGKEQAVTCSPMLRLSLVTY